MSNLEPGCKAIVISGECKENIGKIVTVGNFIGEREDYKGSDWREVNVKMRDTWGDFFYFNRDAYMQRIDDHDIEIHKTEKELELTA